jgi:hypothetical protein
MMVDRRRLAVLVLALVALLLRDGSLSHQHLSTAPGLYNHDHDLCTLATVAGGLIPDPPEPGLVRVALAPIVAAAWPFGPWRPGVSPTLALLLPRTSARLLR